MPQTTLREARHIAKDTLALWMDTPEGFDHEAGQALDLTLKGGTRHFTIASAPGEDRLSVATRLTESDFKDALTEVDAGAQVEIDGPDGQFTLHDEADVPAVFIAGGIGITPFRSMILDALADGDGPTMTLFYSNRHAEDAAYLAMLQQTADEEGDFELVATMTDESDWDGETGHIDAQMLRRHLDGLDGHVFYIAGPPDMVRDMGRMLRDAGVDNDRIVTERFSGY